MRVTICTLIFAISVWSIASAQTTRRVNNTPTLNAPYTTIDAAIAAAVTDDIILVEGSTTTYALPTNYTLTKRVHIRGPGYILTSNTGLQSNPNAAEVAMTGSFILGAGSDGSTIQGMTWPVIVSVRASNITIQHNRMLRIILDNTVPCSNLTLRANILGAFNTVGAGVITASGGIAFTNINMSNNICGWTINLASNCQGLFANNYIYVSLSGYPSNIGNLAVANNIFEIASGSTITFLNPSVQHNLFIGTGYYPVFDPGLNNLINQSNPAIFVGTGSPDGVYILKTASPAIGAGLDGTDAGIYGGLSPYTLSGIAKGTPTVNALTVPALVPANYPLNITISAKVH